MQAIFNQAAQVARANRKGKRKGNRGNARGGNASIGVGAITAGLASTSINFTNRMSGRSTNNGEVMKGRQYIDDIKTTAAVDLTRAYAMLTDDMSSWLRRKGKLYELYLIKKLSLHYVPKSDTRDGSVCIRWEPNVGDSPPTTKVAFLNTSDVISTGAIGYSKQVIPVMALAKKRRFKVGVERSVAAEVGNLHEDYHQGVIQVLTTGFGVTTTVGELWVDYEIEFFSRAETNEVAAESFVQTTGFGPAGSVFTGSAKKETEDDRIPVGLHGSAAGFATAPHFDVTQPGHYRVHFHVNGTGLNGPTVVAVPGDTYTGGTPTITILSQFINAAATFATVVATIYVPPTLATLWQAGGDNPMATTLRLYTQLTSYTTVVLAAFEVIAHAQKKAAFTF
jgi:hypothetical protein